ncbi:Aspartyl protease [Candidatus Magnetomoraceae bacterium gMMP-15]
MKIYKTQRISSLMIVKAYIKGPEAVAYPRMLIDTGAVVTIVAQEILESVGCSPALTSERRRIVTASGYEILPVVRVNEVNCCGYMIKDYPVVAHTLPFGTYVNGLVGMDFLKQFEIEIKPFSGEIIAR